MLIQDEQLEQILKIIKLTSAKDLKSENLNLQNRFDYLFQFTQQFWLRHANTERWNLKDDEILEKYHHEIFYLLHKLGFIKEVSPKDSSYNYVLLLGISDPASLLSRINYLKKLWLKNIKFERIFLLSGNVDIQKIWPQWQNHPDFFFDKPLLTDTELMHSVYQQCSQDWPEELQKIPVIQVVGSSSNPTRRVNTRDTLIEWNKREEVKSKVLLISNQPFVPYQHLVAESVLAPQYSIETVGDNIDETTPIRVIFDSVARYLYELKNKKKQ